MKVNAVSRSYYLTKKLRYWEKPLSIKHIKNNQGQRQGLLWLSSGSQSSIVHSPFLSSVNLETIKITYIMVIFF